MPGGNFSRTTANVLSSGTVADTSTQILDPRTPKPARPLSTSEREDSIPKRQRPAEVNTVLVIAGGDSRIEMSTLTDDQKALHNAKVNELPDLDKFDVVEVVHRPRSQQVLSTRWNQCMLSQHQKHSWTLPQYGFARKLIKDSRFLFRHGVFTAHRKPTT